MDANIYNAIEYLITSLQEMKFSDKLNGEKCTKALIKLINEKIIFEEVGLSVGMFHPFRKNSCYANNAKAVDDLLVPLLNNDKMDEYYAIYDWGQQTEENNFILKEIVTNA
jgi:hypothetical protein